MILKVPLLYAKRYSNNKGNNKFQIGALGYF